LTTIETLTGFPLGGQGKYHSSTGPDRFLTVSTYWNYFPLPDYPSDGLGKHGTHQLSTEPMHLQTCFTESLSKLSEQVSKQISRTAVESDSHT